MARLRNGSAATRKLRRALSLPPQDWRRLWQAWWLLVGVDLGLRLLPFRRVQAWLVETPQCAAPLPPEQAQAVIEHTAWLVDVARRYHPARYTCLRRALVLQRLLYREGVATQLRFGVRKEGGQLQAHAWLEFQGQPVGDPEALTGRFVPLAEAAAKPAG